MLLFQVIVKVHLKQYMFVKLHTLFLLSDTLVFEIYSDWHQCEASHIVAWYDEYLCQWIDWITFV